MRAISPALATLLLALYGAAVAAQPVQTLSPDDQARFLAGLPVSAGSALEPLAASPGAKVHQAEMAKAWERLEKEMLDEMRP